MPQRRAASRRRALGRIRPARRTVGRRARQRDSEPDGHVESGGGPRDADCGRAAGSSSTTPGPRHLPEGWAVSFEALALLLVGLLVVPLTLAGYVALEKRTSRYGVRFTNLDVLALVLEERRPWGRHVPAALLPAAVAALFVALARPEITVAAPQERATVVLLVDVSGSMRAEDVAPSRLEAARAAMHAFLDRVPKEIRVSVVAFSDGPEVIVPPTADRDLIRSGVDLLDSRLRHRPGRRARARRGARRRRGGGGRDREGSRRRRWQVAGRRPAALRRQADAGRAHPGRGRRPRTRGACAGVRDRIGHGYRHDRGLPLRPAADGERAARPRNAAAGGRHHRRRVLRRAGRGAAERRLRAAGLAGRAGRRAAGGERRLRRRRRPARPRRHRDRHRSRAAAAERGAEGLRPRPPEADAGGGGGGGG